MIRLLLEDVTLVREEGVVAKVRFKGGATTELKVPIPPGGNEWFRTPEATLARIRELSKEMTADAMLLRLETEGIRPAYGRGSLVPGSTCFDPSIGFPVHADTGAAKGS